MGAIKNFFLGPQPAPSHAPKWTRFSAVGSDFETWNALLSFYSGQSVTRREAMGVPAIVAARDKFCNLGAVLPIHVRNATGEFVDTKLLTQPERFNGLTRSRTLSMTIDDLFFHGTCLWHVVDRDYTSYPTVVDRIPHGRWEVDSETRTVTVDGTKINPMNAVIFTSPKEGILSFGGPVIKALIALEATAAMRINQPQAMEYFRSTSGTDPDDETVQGFLDDIAAVRKRNASGWLPPDIERIPVETPTPEQLQLKESREFSILEVSRLTGLTAHQLGVAVTTRTYTNLQDERRDFIETQAAPFLTAIEERLSLGDITPTGQRVKWTYDAFLRANTSERYQTYSTAIQSGFLTVDEVRALKDRPRLDGGS